MPRSSTLRFEVWRGDDLFFAGVIPHRRPLRIGPSKQADVPAKLREDLDLLVPADGGGYGLFLVAPLSGQLAVGDRTIRITDGLLVDPRPEPLRLRDGDHATIDLPQTRLRLQVSICADPHLSHLNPLDWNLGITLIGTSLAALVLAVVVLDTPLADRPRIRPPVLRPATVSPSLLARPFKRPPPTAGQQKLAQRGRNSATTPTARPKEARRQRQRGAPQRARAALRRVDAALAGLLSMATTGHRAGAFTQTAPATASLAPLLGELTKPSVAAVPKVRLKALAAPRARLPRPAKDPESGPTRDQIAKVVARGSGKIQHCFERELLTSGRSLDGRILLRWKVDVRGQVIGLRVISDTVGSKAIQKCVVQTVSRWQFPSDRTSYAVVFPFEFLVRS